MSFRSQEYRYRRNQQYDVLPECLPVRQHPGIAKHPQSDTGFAKARYKVNGVITLIRRSAKVDAIFRRTPKKEEKLLHRTLQMTE